MLVRLPIAAFKRTDELTVAQFARLLMLLRVPREPREQLSDSRSPSGVNDSLEEQQFSELSSFVDSAMSRSNSSSARFACSGVSSISAPNAFSFTVLIVSVAASLSRIRHSGLKKTARKATAVTGQAKAEAYRRTPLLSFCGGQRRGLTRKR